LFDFKQRESNDDDVKKSLLEEPIVTTEAKTEETPIKKTRHMFHREENVVGGIVQLTSDATLKKDKFAGKDDESDIIRNTEDVDVHLPDTKNEEEGVSFKEGLEDQISVGQGVKVIMNEEEVEAHLPDTEFEEVGVSFRNEHKEVENEEEVEAHLPDGDDYDNTGVSFRDEEHKGIESHAEIDTALPPGDIQDEGKAFSAENHNITSEEELMSVTLPPSNLIEDNGVGFLKENRSYTIRPEEDFVDATLPYYTIDDGIGFMAENHTNITKEAELTNVTLPPDKVVNDTLSFRDEKHAGLKKEEELTNVTLPKVDLTAEDGTTFKSENRTYTIQDESELTNVSLPTVPLKDYFTSFIMEKHNITSEEELGNITLPKSELGDKGITFKEEDHTNFNATDVEAVNITLPNIDLNDEDGADFRHEKRNYIIPSEEERDNVSLLNNATTDDGVSFSEEIHNITSEEEVPITLPPSYVSTTEELSFSAENHTGMTTEEETEDVTLGPAELDKDDGVGFNNENRTYVIPNEEEKEVLLATEAPKATQKSFFNEDHASLKLEAELEVTLEPSILGEDQGVGFMEEVHNDIKWEPDVEAHMPGAEDDKSESFIQSHVIADTIVGDDGSETADRSTVAFLNKVEFAQEIDSGQAAKDSGRVEAEMEQQVSFAREIHGEKADMGLADGEETLKAKETNPRAPPRPTTAIVFERKPGRWTTQTIWAMKRVEAKEADRTRDADPMEKLKNDLLDLHFLVEEIAGKEEERP